METEVPEIVNQYQYDEANRLISKNGINYTWDANGNLLSDGESDYIYDSANRLVSVAQNGRFSNYAYNGLGDRVLQTINGLTTNYVLDLNTGLTQVLQDGTNTYLYGINRVAQSTAEQSEFFLADALGSVRNLSNPLAEITLTQSYTPFGEVLNTSGEGQTDYAFTGEMYDPNTGLVFLRARYYNPYLNQFIQPDTIVPDAYKPWEWHDYMYARNNPILFMDPSGYLACKSDQDVECKIRVMALQKIAQNIKENVTYGSPPVEGFASLIDYAMLLFGNDMEGMVWAVTHVISGFIPERKKPIWMQGWYGDHGSPYWVGQNWLPYNRDFSIPVEGNWIHSQIGDWKEAYWDKTANQAYHFWFYVAVTFYEGNAIAKFADFVHEKNPEKIDLSDDTTPSHTDSTQQDRDLAYKAIEFGNLLTFSYIRQHQELFDKCGMGEYLKVKTINPGNWLRMNLKGEVVTQ